MYPSGLPSRICAVEFRTPPRRTQHAREVRNTLRLVLKNPVLISAPPSHQTLRALSPLAAAFFRVAGRPAAPNCVGAAAHDGGGPRPSRGGRLARALLCLRAMRRRCRDGAPSSRARLERPIATNSFSSLEET